MRSTKRLPYSDLAIEGAIEQNLPVSAYRRRSIEVKEIEIDYNLSLRVGKRSGHYFTLQTTSASTPEGVVTVLADCLIKLFKELGVEQGKVLVVGLGNDNYVVDALGAKVVSKLSPDSISKFNLCVLEPSVEGNSGISSFDVVKGVVSAIKPRLVIAIDTLVTSKLDRLSTCYQLTTAGISPGGGVGAKLPALGKSSLGVDTIAIGVPLIISLSAVCPDISPARGRLQVTLKDVDDKVDFCSTIIAKSIVRALQKS